jgi:Cys-tRNA(Pro) deacylase
MTTTSTSTNRVIDAARQSGLSIEVREFPEGTRTAEEAARAVGVEVGQIVKSLLFMVDGKPVLCLVAGTNRLSPAKLAQLASASEVRRADAGEVRSATGYAVGGVPPFGHPAALPVYCDQDLLLYDSVWAAAGTPMAVFSVAPNSLVEVCSARVADLREED